MQQLIDTITTGATPFCLIQKQDSEDILFLSGENGCCRAIQDIPRRVGSTSGGRSYDTISVVPFRQISERGYKAHDGGEEILTIRIDRQEELDAQTLLGALVDEDIRLSRDISYDTTEEEYGRIIKEIVENEIGNGEGANFVIPRNGRGKIADFSVRKALAIFKSLVENDYGTYWKFLFYDTHRTFIGSTPERHLSVSGCRVKMNPISGTFRKDRDWRSRKAFKADLLKFLQDEKEIDELFMVVDEELKMMARMCDRGGAIIGPLIKEMSRVIHSEYLLSGESDKDIFELFKDSMFAATVVGSPVENACNIIKKYSTASRRYYGSAMMLVGREEDGQDFLDAPITIRTIEIDGDGLLQFSVGATLVKNSVPEEEVAETKAKGAALLSTIVPNSFVPARPPELTRLYNDDEIIETLVQRNQNLSNFWFFRQDARNIRTRKEKIRITIIHNEDDFVYMLAHMFSCMDISVTVIRFDEYDMDHDDSDLTLLGPGPGNPNEDEVQKISINLRIAEELVTRKKPSLFICLGHQILCRTLGIEVRRKERPLQGTQMRIDLFGQNELVGFYNTFAPQTPGDMVGMEFATLVESNELVGIRGPSFIGYQFHPESLLTQNGFLILQDTVNRLLS
ncbi:anthranilate synthase family protein [Desulforhopalus singaporensis]|uniref:anthranilate synthase n=1 Tax=Desulforhopalus singaporensis TaxID=91360 RepID=A0A1H0KM26_9BACT|nr:anthranilate synthase family protein [Desulforhopalus singaporensis]SDO56863.1 phenazine biosynthesis protein phzE [Desulforhopalus singaporensis]